MCLIKGEGRVWTAFYHCHVRALSLDLILFTSWFQLMHLPIDGPFSSFAFSLPLFHMHKLNWHVTLQSLRETCTNISDENDNNKLLHE